MGIYRYSQSKVIDEVLIKRTANGSVRGYLQAREGVDPAAVENVLKGLRDKGYEYTPFIYEGKPMLEVRGFKSEPKFIRMLEENKWLAGPSTYKQLPEEKITFMDKLKKRTLQASGISYLVGDVGFWTYGRKEADALVMAGSVFYFLGTLSLVFYGRNDQSDLQVRELAKDLSQFLTKEKVAVPKDSSLHEYAREKHKGLAQSANDFAKRYPSEIFNTVTAIAGMFVAASAHKKVKFANALSKDTKALFKNAEGKMDYGLKGITATSSILEDKKHIRASLKESWQDVGLGTITAASGIFATVVKEKKPDPDDKPAKGLAWIWEKIRAHPLAIAGGGYTIATLCHGLSTYGAYKQAKLTGDTERLASVPWRGLFVGAALLSEFLLAISSKGHGEGVVSDKSVDHSTIAIAADFIARQPTNIQDKLVNDISRFLGQSDELAMKNEALIKDLKAQVDAMRKNPWVLGRQKLESAANIAAKESVAKAPEPVQHPATTRVPKPLPDWQAKAAAVKDSGLQPQMS